jgi:anti-sigma factor RsiW
MERKTAREHVLADELVDYLKGELAPQREEMIAEHLQSCAECAERALEVAKTVSALLSWTPEAHGDAYRVQLRESVRQALENAAQAQEDPEIAARLGRWLEQDAGLARGAAGLYFDATRATHEISAEGLDFLLTPEASVPIEPDAVVKTVARVHERLVDRAGDAAAGVRARVEASEGSDAEMRIDSARNMDGIALSPTARIQTGADGSVLVEIDASGERPRAPLVMLIPTEGRFEAVVQQTFPASGGAFQTRFTSTEPINYVMLIEPEYAD